MPQLTQQQQHLLLLGLQQQAQAAQAFQARLAAAAALNKLQQQQHSGQPYLQVHHLQQAQAHAHSQQQQQQQQHNVAAASLAQQQHQQRFEKNSPPNAVIVSQSSFVDPTLQYQAAVAAAVAANHQQQGLVSRHPGKVAAPYGGNDIAPPPQPQPLPQHAQHAQQQQLQGFHQYGKAHAGLVHPQQQQPRPALLAHSTAMVQALEHGNGNQPQQQQHGVMERQHRDIGSEASGKSGLSISATPFIPTSQPLSSNTPPEARKFSGSTPNVSGEGIPPPPSVSAVPVAGSHVTHPGAPLLQRVVLPPHHMVATPPPGGMLPIPRPHLQQMHVSNPPGQFQHPAQRKTSASAPPPQGQSLLGGPAFQIIDKPHHPTGTVPRQLSNEGSGGSNKPPPGLSLPLRPNLMGEQGSTPTPPGVVMATGLELQARTMALNRALVNTAPSTVGTGYAVRPQHAHPHHMPELSSLYGAPPKLQPTVSTGGNKRALLPTPPAAGPIPTPLGFLAAAGTPHHITPNVNVPPGWPGAANMRIAPHRVPPPGTNPSGHRQPVIYTQEQQQQVVQQRSSYNGGNYNRGNGGGI